MSLVNYLKDWKYFTRKELNINNKCNVKSSEKQFSKKLILMYGRIIKDNIEKDHSLDERLDIECIQTNIL